MVIRAGPRGQGPWRQALGLEQGNQGPPLSLAQPKEAGGSPTLVLAGARRTWRSRCRPRRRADLEVSELRNLEMKRRVLRRRDQPRHPHIVPGRFQKQILVAR